MTHSTETFLERLSECQWVELIIEISSSVKILIRKLKIWERFLAIAGDALSDDYEKFHIPK